MSSAREGQTATLLPGGQVLVAGGQSPKGPSLASAELYDAASGTFETTGSMLVPRSYQSAVVLKDGRVLVVNGDFGETAEIYDPATGSFLAGPPLAIHGRSEAVALLSDGRVLVAGGDSAGDALASAQIYKP